MKFRNLPLQLGILESDSTITKIVKHDYNTLTDVLFFSKYKCHKSTYAKRVLKYSDPYMNGPLAKLGKWLSKHF